MRLAFTLLRLLWWDLNPANKPQSEVVYLAPCNTDGHHTVYAGQTKQIRNIVIFWSDHFAFIEIEFKL